MNKLSRLWDRLLPGLIYLDPTVATACYQAVDEDEASLSRRHALVSLVLRSETAIDLADATPPVPISRTLTVVRG
jgi:hypothetical protein